MVVFAEVAIDRSLKINDRLKAAAADARRVSVEKKVSTAFSHDPDVGVKWNRQRG